MVVGIGLVIVLLLALILLAVIGSQIRYDGPGSALIMIILIVAALLFIFAR